MLHAGFKAGGDNDHCPPPPPMRFIKINGGQDAMRAKAYHKTLYEFRDGVCNDCKCTKCKLKKVNSLYMRTSKIDR